MSLFVSVRIGPDGRVRSIRQVERMYGAAPSSEPPTAMDDCMRDSLTNAVFKVRRVMRMEMSTTGIF